MPKQIHTIGRFDGGLSQDADPRDIRDSELVEATDIEVSSIGRITMLGGFTAHESNGADGDTTWGDGEAGTGLFTFSNDYNLLSSAEDIAGDTTPEAAQYLVLYSDTSSNAKIALFQKTAGGVLGWHDGGGLYSTLDLGGDPGKFSFYVLHGNLRIFDSSHTNGNLAKWLGVVTPQVYLADSGGNTRVYGSYTTQCEASVNRTGGADTFLPQFTNQILARQLTPALTTIPDKGCFPEVSNQSGDTVAKNAIAYSVWTQNVSVTAKTFRYKDEGIDVSNDSIEDTVGNRFREFDVGDHITISGFTNSAFNRVDVTLTSVAVDEIGFATLSGTDSEAIGQVVNVVRIEAASSTNDIAGAGFALEQSDLRGVHTGGAGGVVNAKWGAALMFAEDTTGNNTGTWMPETTTRYRFYITTVFDDGTQESLPQLMAMYGSKSLSLSYSDIYDVNYKGTYSGAYSELYFSKGVPAEDQTTETHEVQGEMIALHLKPFVKVNGATKLDASNDTLAFGASTSGADGTAGEEGNPRISGVRIYWSSNEDGHSELWRIFDCDFYKGVKTYGMDAPSGTDGWSPWQNFSRYYDSDQKAANGHYAIPDWDRGNRFTHPPRILSYYTANQHSHHDSITLNSVGSAVVANNRVYAGNVNQRINNEDIQFSDRIMKSPIGQPDKFPQDSYIQSAKNDGDAIIHLATFGDRLLQFNKHVMYMINISQVDEFPEATFKFKGVDSGCSVCTTDKGIAWANELGAYFYDGNEVIDLLDQGGRRAIPVDTWKAFASIPMVGYIPDKGQLLFVESSGTTGDASAYIYTMATKSWTHGHNATIADVIKTNFINDYNGDLIYYDYTAQEMKKWDSAPDTSSNVNIITKDFDFGVPGVRKKIYKLYISYKGDASGLTIKYATNGETDASDLKEFLYSTTPLLDKSSAENLESWHLGALIPSTASEANNIFSIKLHITGTASANFEVNDISVIYRRKGIR